MTKEFKIYNLEEEIEKYSKIADDICQDVVVSTENNSNKNSIRDTYRELLINKLNIPLLEATDLEIGVFNATIDYATNNKVQLSWKSQLFTDTYMNIARSIYSNLKKDSYISNENLLTRLMVNKEFLPHVLPYMQSKDIFPERWNNIIEKNKLRFKAAYEIKQVAMTDMVQCSRCKGKKISYYELQTRSGDESMTIFMNCLICGKKWKQ